MSEPKASESMSNVLVCGAKRSTARGRTDRRSVARARQGWVGRP